MNIQDNYVRHIHSIEDVHDGDTIKALVELGYNDIGRVTFRLKGINTAEVNKKQNTETRMKLGLDAKAHVQEIVKTYPTRVLSEKFEDGGFGRFLGVIYYQKDGNWIDLNQELLDLKLAQTYHVGASKDFGDFITE